MDKTKDSHRKPADTARNYQIDFLKMFLAVLVFVCHTEIFLDVESRGTLYNRFTSFGYISVYLFFIISGFLMIKSIVKRDLDPNNAGKSAVNYVINKFKPIALPFWIANAMFLFMYIAYYIYMYIYDTEKMAAFQNVVGEHFNSPIDLIIKVIPEFFCITNVGGMLYGWNNAPTWYISAMLFAMIPLAYLAIKKRDFFINIFSLVTSVLLLGFLKESMQNTNSYVGIIRAVCGLCFGVVSWNIYRKIIELNNTRLTRIIFTFAEILIYSVFFGALFVCGEDMDVMYSLLLLMPIVIAITFSGKSYISALFRAKWMKYLGAMSLYVYLNHYASMQIVRSVFPSGGYSLCLICAAVCTVILCLVNFLVGKVILYIISSVKRSREIGQM